MFEDFSYILEKIIPPKRSSYKIIIYVPKQRKPERETERDIEKENGQERAIEEERERERAKEWNTERKILKNPSSRLAPVIKLEKCLKIKKPR